MQENTNPFTPEPLPDALGPSTSSKALEGRCEQLESSAAGLESVAEEFERRAAAKEAEIDAVADRIGKAEAQNARAAARQEVYNSMAGSKDAPLFDKMRQVKRFAAAFEETKQWWGDDVAVLDRETLKSPERATYSANLKDAGPAALLNAGREAILKKDSALGMAVINRLQALRPSSRLISPAEIAAAALPEEARKVRALFTWAEASIRRAEAAFARVKPRPAARAGALRKISHGLAERRNG
jgi:hypothetical protein